MSVKKIRIAVLVSGRGSNMAAIQSAIEKNTLDAKIVLVVSDNKDAKALEYAKQKGIFAQFIHPGLFKTKLEGKAESVYIEVIQKVKPDLIVLAGFMRVIKHRFITSFTGKIINIHPSLLPKYSGLHTHKRALDAGDKYTGCTVHFVNEVIDGGKRIMQAKVAIQEGDTEKDLAAKVLKVEHKILPAVINLIAKGKVNERECPLEPILYQG